MTGNSARLAAVEHAQHDDAIAIDPIPEYVSRPQYAQDDLPILLASGNRVSEPWLCLQQRGLGKDFAGHSGSESRIALVKKSGETIEVGEGRRRPFDPHCS